MKAPYSYTPKEQTGIVTVDQLIRELQKYPGYLSVGVALNGHSMDIKETHDSPEGIVIEFKGTVS